MYFYSFSVRTLTVVDLVVQVLPEVVSRLLWDIGFPCLLTASIIIQYTFAELSQVRPARVAFSPTVCDLARLL